VTLWLPGWKRRGWKTKQNSDVANKDLWQDLAIAMEGRMADTEWIKVPSHVGLHGNEMADRMADEGVLLHGVPIRGKEAATLQSLKRTREEMEMQQEEQREVRQPPPMAVTHRQPHNDKRTSTTATDPISTVVVQPAPIPVVAGSNPGWGLFLQDTQALEASNSAQPLVLLPIPVEETEGWQEMELRRRESLTTALSQKREMIQQHHIDTRQMVLLLHLQLGWQQWHTQKAEWWNAAKEWTKERRQAALRAEERTGRQEIQGDRGYWALGVMMIHYEGQHEAIKSEEKRWRTTLKTLSKEDRYRILQNTREREQRSVILHSRLRGLEKIARKTQTEEEMEARRHIQRDSGRSAWWQMYMRQRRMVEVDEVKRRQLLEAGHRRLMNKIRSVQDQTLTTTDIDETRQYLVPMTVDLPKTVSSRRSVQFSSKRRREQPSDGRERSPKRRRRSATM
jgi:hypothetical protein